MHFTFDVSIGQIILLAAFLGGMWRLNRLLSFLLFEHEILMKDYCDRVGINMKDLPSRTALKGWNKWQGGNG